MNVHGMEVNLGLEELKRLDLPPQTFELVKKAREAAAGIIFHLVPEHISSYADLIRKLVRALESTRTEAYVEERLAGIRS